MDIRAQHDFDRDPTDHQAARRLLEAARRLGDDAAASDVLSRVKGVPYKDTKEVAALVRVALKKHFGKRFPKCKFSVRTSRYAGGSSIRVCWTDGPCPALVEHVVGPFQGSAFDGMRDMKVSLPPHEFDGEFFRSGCDYIFTERTLSRDTTMRLIAVVEKWYGYKFEGEVVDSVQGGVYLRGHAKSIPGTHRSFSDEVYTFGRRTCIGDQDAEGGPDHIMADDLVPWSTACLLPPLDD